MEKFQEQHNTKEIYQKNKGFNFHKSYKAQP
jgi:hypothetical protein